MASTNKDCEENCSGINLVVTPKYTISVHKGIHRVGFDKPVPQATKEIWKFAKKEVGIAYVCLYHTQQSCVGQWNKEHFILCCHALIQKL